MGPAWAAPVPAQVPPDEEELDEELEGPDLDAGELGEIEDMPEELLGEEVVVEG